MGEYAEDELDRNMDESWYDDFYLEDGDDCPNCRGVLIDGFCSECGYYEED